MRLNKPLKILILILTLAPPIYMGLFFFFIFSSVMRKPTKNDLIFAHFQLFFITHGIVMLLMVALMVFYVVYLFRTDKVDQQKKVLWAIALFMGAPIAMPIFWYLYVWK